MAKMLIETEMLEEKQDPCVDCSHSQTEINGNSMCGFCNLYLLQQERPIYLKIE